MDSQATYSGVIKMWEFVGCPKDCNFEWHARDCVFGDCDYCGVNDLLLCPIEEDGSSSTLVS
jgi:hypothetical protein